MTGKGLDFYIPQWARPTRDHVRGSAMMDVDVTSVDDPEWGILRVETRTMTLNERSYSHFLSVYVFEISECHGCQC